MLIGYNQEFEVICKIENREVSCKDRRVNKTYFPISYGVMLDGNYLLKGKYNSYIDKVYILPNDIIKIED